MFFFHVFIYSIYFLSSNYFILLFYFLFSLIFGNTNIPFLYFLNFSLHTNLFVVGHIVH
jgi:hypothetical protein